MQLKRLFSSVYAKGTEQYLKTQKRYEVARTVLYFGISISLFIAGYLQTKSRVNLLTVVAVLGCLPASKSAVNAIMFLRYNGCSTQAAEEIKNHSGSLKCLFDCVFTSYKINFCISHLAVRGNTICGFTEDVNFKESEFYKHIQEILKSDGHKEVTVKVFNNLSKYIERLSQMNALEADEEKSQAIIETLKSVML